MNTTQERLEELAWALRRRRLLAAAARKHGGTGRTTTSLETRDPLLVLLERIAVALEARLGER